jgi:hypothetical protein
MGILLKRQENSTKGIFHKISVLAVIVGTSLFLISCAAMVPMHLGASYKMMPEAPRSGERVIEKISLEGPVIQRGIDPQTGRPTVPSDRRMGADYNVPENRKPPRHRDEPALDQLIADARRRFPNEPSIDIRNASITYQFMGTRQESRQVTHHSTGQPPVTRTEVFTVADYQIRFNADVVISEPVVIEMKNEYRGMLNAPESNERVFDTVRANNAIARHDTPPQAMGAPYRVSERRRGERHRDEVVLEQLLNQAKSRYQNENIAIRGARIDGNNHPNFSYRAVVVTTDPMPQPVSISTPIILRGATRNDLYRRIDNWFDDRRFNEQTRTTGILYHRRDFDVGRIRGFYIYTVAHSGRNYLMVSSFTVDVHDARAQISFPDTRLIRPESSRGEAWGTWVSLTDERRSADEIPNAEPIFLQSIADLAKAEMNNFTENLKRSISAQ